MNSRIVMFGCVLFSLFSVERELLAAEEEKIPASAVVRDPRLGPSLTLLFDGQESPNVLLHHAVMVFATSDISSDSPHKILGVPDTFSDAQIIGALKKFYSTWEPDEGLGQRKPQLIFAAENWGAGSTLTEPLRELSQKFEIDVYFYYPVGPSFAKSAKHPTPNDKRLASLVETEPSIQQKSTP